MTSTTLDLDTPYPLTDAQVAQFRRDGYIKLKDVLSPPVLAHYGAEVSRLVEALKTEQREMRHRDVYGKAFLQITNLWTQNDAVRAFVLSKRLGRIATELMGTSGVRLYHDQALYKEPGGGYTPWHVDQFYWPLANENTVTAWIPLAAVPMENGPLEFSVGSQKIMFGRELGISEESERAIGEHLRVTDFPVDRSPFDLGEVSFHYGYTFHRAGPNTSDQMRQVMTIIYMDREMRLAPPKSQNQEIESETWMPGAKVGEPIDSPLNPVIYER